MYAFQGSVWYNMEVAQFCVLPSSLPKCDCWEGDQYPDLEVIVHDGHKADYNFAAPAKM